MPDFISKRIKFIFTQIDRHFDSPAATWVGAGWLVISEAMYWSTRREMAVPITRIMMPAMRTTLRFEPPLERRNFAAAIPASRDLSN